MRSFAGGCQSGHEGRGLRQSDDSSPQEARADTWSLPDQVRELPVGGQRHSHFDAFAPGSSLDVALASGTDRRIAGRSVGGSDADQGAERRVTDAAEKGLRLRREATAREKEHEGENAIDLGVLVIA